MNKFGLFFDQIGYSKSFISSKFLLFFPFSFKKLILLKLINFSGSKKNYVINSFTSVFSFIQLFQELIIDKNCLSLLSNPSPCNSIAQKL